MKFRTGKDSRKSITLTVYNNFTAVKEIRSLNSENEVDYLIVRDLPSGLEEDSFFINGVSVLDQSYDEGVIDKNQLLKKYIGRLIIIRNLELGRETKVRLLKADSDIIGEIEETGEIVINPSGEILLPSVEEMQFHPSITCRIEPSQLDKDIELYYLVSGLRWEANYIVQLTEDKFLLNGWIKLINQTNAAFENCELKAVAGIVKRSGNISGATENRHFNAEVFSGQSQPYGYSEATMYRINETFSIAEGESKQIKFLHNEHAACQRVYRIENRNQHAFVQLQFGGVKNLGLNFPLPKGIIKFYERNVKDELEFIGEDEVGYAAQGEKLKVKISETLDLTNKSREKSRKIIENFEYVTFEYQIKNNKQKNVSVLIEHIVYDQLWEMESATHDYEVKDSRTLEFHVRIGAGKTVDLEFTYKVINR